MKKNYFDLFKDYVFGDNRNSKERKERVMEVFSNASYNGKSLINDSVKIDSVIKMGDEYKINVIMDNNINRMITMDSSENNIMLTEFDMDHPNFSLSSENSYILFEDADYMKLIASFVFRINDYENIKIESFY